MERATSRISRVPAEKIQDKRHVPTQRAGTDEEMAHGVQFLARNKVCEWRDY